MAPLVRVPSSEAGTEHGQPVYRIFHQALIERLRPEGKETQRQHDLVGALMRAVPPGAAGPDWPRAPSYIRRHLAAHAAAAGLLDDLLEDPLYLLTVDPRRRSQVCCAALAASSASSSMRSLSWSRVSRQMAAAS